MLIPILATFFGLIIAVAIFVLVGYIDDLIRYNLIKEIVAKIREATDGSIDINPHSFHRTSAVEEIKKEIHAEIRKLHRSKNGKTTQ